MRKRTLSDEGLHLYLNATAPSRPRRWYQYLICNLFHSDYDERLYDVVWKCRESTKALCADFSNPRLTDHLEAAVHNTIQLILSGPTRRQRDKDFRFFADVMHRAFQDQDHQTAHMLYTTLTRPMDVRRPQKIQDWLEAIGAFYGAPSYKRHVQFWRTVRGDQTLPSVIAFHTFIKRRRFMGRNDEVDEATEYMDIFQYLDHDKKALLNIYKF